MRSMARIVTWKLILLWTRSLSPEICNPQGLGWFYQYLTALCVYYVRYLVNTAIRIKITSRSALANITMIYVMLIMLFFFGGNDRLKINVNIKFMLLNACVLLILNGKYHQSFVTRPSVTPDSFLSRILTWDQIKIDLVQIYVQKGEQYLAQHINATKKQRLFNINLLRLRRLDESI